MAAQMLIGELAAVLSTGRFAVGGESIEIGRQLEMAELDLLSAQDALEKACWQADITAAPGDDRSFEQSAGPVSLTVAPPAKTLVSSDAEPAGRRVGHHRRRRPLAHGQGELFPIYHSGDGA
ncbi:MAG TPA: hypothetical protein VIU87_19340 [Mycobacterium sp.]